MDNTKDLKQKESKQDHEDFNPLSPTNLLPTKTTVKSYYFPARYVFVIMGFTSLINLYLTRANISVIINEIADYNLTAEQAENLGKFNWNHSLQGLVLSSFFIGYMSMHLIGGLMTTIYGPKLTLMFSVFGSALATLFMPLSLQYRSVGAFIFLRVLCGFFSGPGYSALHDVIGRWAPAQESTVIAIITHSGNIIGTLLTYLIGGNMVSGFDKGWIFFFYFTAITSVIWTILAQFMLFDSPDLHPRISEEEKKYIMSSQKPHHQIHSFREVPWKKILTSKAFYPLVVTHFCNNFILYSYLTGSTKYFKNYLHISVMTASYYSMIPFIGNFIISIISPIVTDKIKNKNIVSLTNIRKINSILGFTLAAIFSFIIGDVPATNTVAVVSVMTLGLSLLAFNQSGFFVTIIDVCPSLAGIVIGLTNTIGSMAGAANPYISGYIVDTVGNYQFGMKIFFILSGCISLFGGIIFAIFATAEKQDWDEDNHQVELTKIA